jgi:hypothetical protein
MTTPILKRGSGSRPSGEWNDDDFDVLADGAVVGRILKVYAAPVGTSWMWTLAFGHHRPPTHGYAATREAVMAAFAKSWRRDPPSGALGQHSAEKPISTNLLVNSRKIERHTSAADLEHSQIRVGLNVD